MSDPLFSLSFLQAHVDDYLNNHVEEDHTPREIVEGFIEFVNDEADMLKREEGDDLA